MRKTQLLIWLILVFILSAVASRTPRDPDDEKPLARASAPATKRVYPALVWQKNQSHPHQKEGVSLQLSRDEAGDYSVRVLVEGSDRFLYTSPCSSNNFYFKVFDGEMVAAPPRRLCPLRHVHPTSLSVYKAGKPVIWTLRQEQIRNWLGPDLLKRRDLKISVVMNSIGATEPPTREPTPALYRKGKDPLIHPSGPYALRDLSRGVVESNIVDLKF